MGLPAEEVFERFEIEFDAGQDPIFHGGELITGSLKVNLKQQITINAIRLQFKGRACWVGDAKDGEVEKVYFDKDMVLLERPPGRPEPGHFPWNANFTYSLPFECPLPKGCPTSYESPKAFIRYYARATLQTDENDTTQYLVKKAFSIVSPPELHQLLPPQSEPTSKKETIAFGGCCCRGKITAEVSLPKSAYAPGEEIIGTLNVDNKHPRHIVDQIEVRLVDRAKKADDQETTASSSSKPFVNHRVLHLRKLEKGDVIKGKTTVTRDNVKFLQVPPVHWSTPGDKPDQPSTPELISSLGPDGQVSRLLESPSTATLKMRKQPFIRVEYALQVSLGANVLIEVPIEIHPIPIYANGIGFQPFAAGAQPIGEPDEADKKAFHGPFTFAPQYPVYLESPKPVEMTREVTYEQSAVPNGVSELTRTVEISQLPDGSQLVHTKEEYVVATERTSSGNVVEGEGREVQPTVTVQIDPPQPDIAEPIQVCRTEIVTPPENIEEQNIQPIQVCRTEIVSTPLIQDEQEAPAETAQNGLTNGTHENGHHVVDHKETDEQLENGHIHTVTEIIEDGPNSKTQVTVENLDFEDENGMKVHVTKTTESTHISTTTAVAE
ncbi:arrestin domain-containing protein 17 [Ditylenchus destructor]|nr:arrestin domain-containing protein 17 [Ditylenchus destructor]